MHPQVWTGEHCARDATTTRRRRTSRRGERKGSTSTAPLGRPDGRDNRGGHSVYASYPHNELTNVRGAQTGLAASPDSLLAHLLSVQFFAEQKEWDAVLQVSEAGLSIIDGLEKEIARFLPMCDD